MNKLPTFPHGEMQEFACAKCGFLNRIELVPQFDSQIQEQSFRNYNLLERSIKPECNLGDCDRPSSTEEEPSASLKDKIDHYARSFRTNLTNNRWWSLTQKVKSRS